MFRRLIRSGVLAAVVGAALAFSGSALANPSTPQLNPIAPTVFAGPLTVGWSPSVFDANAVAKWYELTVLDFTAGTGQTYGTFGTSKTINVVANHTYGLRLRAGEVLNSQAKYSGSDTDVFNVIPMLVIPIYYEVFHPWPRDWPWCLTCPPDRLIFAGDPDPLLGRTLDQIQSARFYDREIVAGIYVDGRGETSAVLR